MPRTGKNLHKRKDGRWEGRYIKAYSESGKAVYGYVYARTYRDAKDKLEQARNRENEAPATEAPPECPELFEDVAKAWLESVKPRVKESTSVKYANLLESYVQPTIGAIPLNELTQERIEAQCLELLHTGGARKTGLSTKTVSSVLSIIRTALDFAVRNGKAVVCDAKSVKITQTAKELHILTKNEQEKLSEYLCANLTPVNLGILTCLCTGLRIGEICALRWEDISLSEQTIHVCRTMQRIQDLGSKERKTKVTVTTPKSPRSIRIIPIPDDLVKLMKIQPTFSVGYFLTGDEVGYIEPRTMQNRFKRVLRECGVPSVNFHCLRHTFATNCIGLGFDVKTLSEILGHASVNITMNRYVHPSMGLKKENMGRISIPFVVK